MAMRNLRVRRAIRRINDKTENATRLAMDEPTESQTYAATDDAIYEEVYDVIYNPIFAAVIMESLRLRKEV